MIRKGVTDRKHKIRETIICPINNDNYTWVKHSS